MYLFKRLSQIKRTVPGCRASTRHVEQRPHYQLGRTELASDHAHHHPSIGRKYPEPLERVSPKPDSQREEDAVRDGRGALLRLPCQAQGRQREAGVSGTEAEAGLGAARVCGGVPASDRQHSRPGEPLGIGCWSDAANI